MKARFVDVDSSVESMFIRLYNVFPDRLAHVNKADIYFVFKDSPKSPWKAKTNVTNGLYRALTKKKIIIQIHKQEWTLMKPVEQALLLYRELYRIDLNEKDKSEYKFIREDVKDFSKILEKVGLHNETADQFFSKVVPVTVH